MKQIHDMDACELAGEVRAWEEGIHTAGLLRDAARLGELKERLIKLTLGEGEPGFWEGAGHFLARLLKVERHLIMAAAMSADAETMVRMGLFRLAHEAGHHDAIQRCIVDGIADYLLQAAASGDWIFQDWGEYEESEVLARLMHDQSAESTMLMKRDLVHQCMPAHLSCAIGSYHLHQVGGLDEASSDVTYQAYDAAMDLLVEEAMRHIARNLERQVLDAMLELCSRSCKGDEPAPPQDATRARDVCRAIASTVALFDFDAARAARYIATVHSNQTGQGAQDEQAWTDVPM